MWTCLCAHVCVVGVDSEFLCYRERLAAWVDSQFKPYRLLRLWCELWGCNWNDWKSALHVFLRRFRGCRGSGELPRYSSIQSSLRVGLTANLTLTALPQRLRVSNQCWDVAAVQHRRRQTESAWLVSVPGTCGRQGGCDGAEGCSTPVGNTNPPKPSNTGAHAVFLCFLLSVWARCELLQCFTLSVTHLYCIIIYLAAVRFQRDQRL